MTVSQLARATSGLLSIVTSLAASPAAAQGETAGTITVNGEVRDVSSGAPIRDAIIRLPDLRRSVATDSMGHFVLTQIPAGPHKWVVGRIGYASWEQEVEATRDGAEYTIGLLPRPEIIEGIEVVADRFETRRRAVAASVRAVDRRDILSSAAGNARNVVASRAGVWITNCAGEDGGLRCSWVRGRLTRPAVYIDDRPALGGLEELVSYLPQELHVIESYAGGRMVRVYTTWYVEQLARTKRMLPPLPVGW